MGHTAVVELLLNYEAEEILTDEGLTTLHCASRSGSVETVLLLLSKVTEPTFLEIRNRKGRTALSEAAERGHLEVVDALIKRGADVGSRDTAGQTPLHLAVKNNVETVVESLIAGGADIEAEDDDGRKPLDVGLSHHSVDAVRLLLKAGTRRAHSGTHHDRCYDPSDSCEEIFEGQLLATPRDQFAAFFYLKEASNNRLPAKIISHILDLSEFWIMSKTQRAEPLTITEHSGATFVYLRSAPILGRSLKPVKRIVFSITSHDQGWSDLPTYHGTYGGSWTWFEAFRQEGNLAPAAGLSEHPRVIRAEDA